MVGGSAFLPTKPVLLLFVTSKSFGGRNAAAPTITNGGAAFLPPKKKVKF
jgi:hypothetical protein